MTIEFLEYESMLRDMLLELEKLTEWKVPEVAKIIAPMCRVLHMARLKQEFYPNARAEAERQGREYILIDNGTPDMSRPFVGREVNATGNVSVYSFYADVDKAEWDADDIEQLHLFEKMLYAFHGRAILRNLVEERTYTDQQLNVRNHLYVLKQVSQIIARHEILSYGMVCFNLAGFSLVNSRIGREAGTKVMSRYIKMLQEKLCVPGVMGRMGGDNFVGIFKKEDLDVIRTHLGGTGVIYNDETNERVLISAVAGYYIPDGKEEINNADDMMDRVMMAVNVARHTKEVKELFFSPELLEKQTEQKIIERQFPEAIAKCMFKVYYQPKVNLEDYSLAGAEALCRSIKDKEVIPPGAFIPVLEQSTNICLLDFYMLEHVCQDIRRWLDQGKEPVRVSVNFSRRHLGDMDLVEHIIDIIDRNYVPHSLIEIELTETTTDVEFADLKRVVNSLQENGICTSVDDFGTGYSSLNLIKQISWNVLKLDKSILPIMTQSEFTNDSIMLRYVVAMATDMGLECIVEGVETGDQVDLLKRNNCYMAQGFYFDRPLPVYEFEKRIDHQKDIYFEGGRREE
ncbi:MAG: EAL domain-containing protein [Lachnospiraceae bacterium]|nr:EAL domain-containing protein [Lachnospiraceae bacterium]